MVTDGISIGNGKVCSLDYTIYRTKYRTHRTRTAIRFRSHKWSWYNHKLFIQTLYKEFMEW